MATADSDPLVSIIVVSYETREMTLECLRSVVRETTDLPFEILVIDNDSKDGSHQAIDEEFGGDSRFIIEKSEDNLGFAGANNEMAKQARGRYVLLLNPDTVVLDNAIGRLLAFAQEHPENRIWGGRTLFDDGSLNPTSCWGEYTLWSQFCRYAGLTHLAPDSPIFNTRGYGGWQRDSVREVGVITGCFLMIEKDDWDLLGGFDPEFFMYGEEVDLCLRGRARGFRPIMSPDATIIHHGGASEKVRVEKLIRLCNAELRLLDRHWPSWKRPFASGLLKSGVLLRATASFVRHPRSTNIWSELFRRRREWLTSGETSSAAPG